MITGANAGVVTPSSPMRCANTPRSVAADTPGPEAPTTAWNDASATPTAARIALTSSRVLTRRTARSSASPSTSSASGNTPGNKVANSGEMPSTPTRRTVVPAAASPAAAARFSGFHEIGNRFDVGISGGTPSSVTLSRCTAPVSPTTTHDGANGRVPASQSRFAPDT